MNRIYSYADYFTCKLKESVELIKERIFQTSPIFSLAHRRTAGKFFNRLSLNLQYNKWEVIISPFEVRFPKSNPMAEKKMNEVVQPDICVVCDASKIDDCGCLGSSDLKVEILSPGNTEKELKNKYSLYLENIVKEYWLVYPLEESLVSYTLNKGKYMPSQMYKLNDEITGTVFKNFKLNLNEIFTNERK